jgi:hypothetical protein
MKGQAESFRRQFSGFRVMDLMITIDTKCRVPNQQTSFSLATFEISLLCWLRKWASHVLEGRRGYVMDNEHHEKGPLS